MKSLKPGLNIFAVLVAAISAVVVLAETNPTGPVPEVQTETPAKMSPAELLAAHCLACHGNPAAGSKRLAPPFAMVKMHYEDLDEAAFVKAVSAWVNQPDKAKSRMPGAIRNFNLMPALVIPEADLAAIVKHLHRTDFPMPGRGRGRGVGPGGGPTGGGKGGPCE